MDSWKRKLGYVLPSWNTVIEYETARLIPSDSSLHVSRIQHTADTLQMFDHMVDAAPESVQLLADAKVDAICFACTAASFYKGRAKDQELARTLSEASGTPVVTMAASIVEAIRRLGLQKVCVGAPYEQWLVDLLAAYLRAAGVDVVRTSGLGHQANILHSPDKAFELAQNAWAPEADGIILSCGNFRTLEVLDAIEERFGKPVITSNTAALWSVLRAAKWTGSVPHAGTLLKDVA